MMKQIRLRYRKVIDANSLGSWERMVWEDSFMEFKMQFQLFNTEKKFYTFGALLNQNEKASQLHFLVGASLLDYLDQLNGVFPDIVDNVGFHFLKINSSQFEIINSDIRNSSKHQVAFNFYSLLMYWHCIIDGFLLVSEIQPPYTEFNNASYYKTHLLKLQPFLTIDQFIDDTNSRDNLHSFSKG